MKGAWSVLLASVVRHLIGLAAGALLARGWITDDISAQITSPEIVTGIVLALVAVGWSALARIRSRWAMRYALIQQPTTSPSRFEARVANTTTKDMRQAVEQYIPRP